MVGNADDRDQGGPLTILKLGGSVITDKNTPETVDDAALDRVLDAIAEAQPDSGAGTIDDGNDGNQLPRLIIVHGGGSFGHVHAAEHGVSTTDGTSNAAAGAAIHGAMKQLNRVVIDQLQSRGVPALPVHPLSVATRNTEGDLSLPTGAVTGLLDAGFIPVLHGDVISHAGCGLTVLSGDEIVTSLARSLHATRVGLCSTVPGVLDEHERVIPSITAFEDVESVLGESDSTDVSGGMAGKVRELLALGAPAHIFGPDAVSTFLAGHQAGTRIDGR